MNFEVMRAKTYSPDRVENWDLIYVDPKLDGVRVVAILKPETVRFYSRNGRELKMFGHLSEPLRRLGSEMFKKDRAMKEGVVFDGEMVADTFGDIAGAIHTKGVTVEGARFFLFAAMPLVSFLKGIDGRSQLSRIQMLEEALSMAEEIDGLSVTSPKRVRSHEEVMLAHSRFRKKGFEGSMVKDLSEPWEAKRSHRWMKIKEELSVDVRVTGIKEGKGKYVGMCGALYVDHRGKRVKVSGMNDAQRELFWNRPKSIVGKLIEVVYQEETVHGSLRHPRFKRVRDDKKEDT